MPPVHHPGLAATADCPKDDRVAGKVSPPTGACQHPVLLPRRWLDRRTPSLRPTVTTCP